MATLNQAKVIKALEKAISASHSQFIYDFLKAYNISNTTIQRLKLGDRQRNIATVPNDIAVQGSLYFRPLPENADLLAATKEIRALPVVKSGKVRFILVTDFKDVVGVDLKVDDQVTFPFDEFKSQYEFFLPLTGLYEKPVAYTEHPADTKACEKMGRLYDGIRSINKYETPEDLQCLNVFLTRLLFCFFAEDTGIFPGYNMMTDAMTANTQRDGSDLSAFFEQLFSILDLPKDDPKRKDFPASFQAFPYVDGGLFREKAAIPTFNTRTRSLLLDCGQMAWRDISPVIFGSMFQAVMDPAQRRSLGAHFTSERNIFKVIGPLFLDDLREELEKILDLPPTKAKIKALQEYQHKLGSLKFLDPACGSGNFLIVAYRELRRLEIQCLSALRPLTNEGDTLLLDASFLVKVHIDQFYGIEILDFPVEVAKVSLYLMEHVMNMEMQKEFGLVYPTIPLKYTPNIVCANALTTPWEEVVRPEELDYVFGNPPFSGGSHMDANQKLWMIDVFGKERTRGMLDYVGTWFELASLAMLRNPRLRAAFVATNSICQGEQAGWLWKPIFSRSQTIRFAHRTFRWNNDAKNAAAVHCIIVGFDAEVGGAKRLFAGENDVENATSETRCRSISPYLIADSTVVVQPQSKPLSAPVPIFYGNKPTDGGHLIIEEADKDDFCKREPRAIPWIRRLMGSEELLHSKLRYCLWLVDAPEDVLRLPLVAERIEKRKQFLLSSKASVTRAYAVKHPELFRQITQPKASSYLAIPRVSSERRPYIPMAVIGEKIIVTDRNFVLPEASFWEFGIATSAMHMVWMRITCCRLKTDYSYSSDLCWNTFPWPTVTEAQKNNIESLADNVLAARDAHPDMTLADMYNPETMPDDLRTAHNTLDRAVDNLYCPGRTFEGDEDRLEILFALYEELTKEK